MKGRERRIAIFPPYLQMVFSISVKRLIKGIFSLTVLPSFFFLTPTPFHSKFLIQSCLPFSRHFIKIAVTFFSLCCLQLIYLSSSCSLFYYPYLSNSSPSHQPPVIPTLYTVGLYFYFGVYSLSFYSFFYFTFYLPDIWLGVF